MTKQIPFRFGGKGLVLCLSEFVGYFVNMIVWRIYSPYGKAEHTGKIRYE